MQENIDQLITRGQAAKMLGISVQTLRNWEAEARETGEAVGPRSIRVGGNVARYRLADVKAVLESSFNLDSCKDRRIRPN